MPAVTDSLHSFRYLVLLIWLIGEKNFDGEEGEI